MAGEITQWIDPAGTITTLDVDWDADGRFMPAPVFQEDQVPGQPGTVFRNVVHEARDFTIRIVYTAATDAALRTVLRASMASMNPLRGNGTIRVTSPVGDVREIACRYKAGLEFKEVADSSGPTMQTCDVTFHAFDPYWRDVSDISQTFTIGAGPVFFPIFPIRLTSSQIAVDTTITNDSDVDAWPVWQLQGPGGAIRLSNLTTGRFTIFLLTVLGSGESMSIDTRPTNQSPTGKTIYRQDGKNLFYDLDPMSALWPLVPGPNAVRLEMTGSTGASSLSLNWRRKWLAV